MTGRDGGATGQATPLVSVVVPMFNHARFVAAALDSVLAEGYPNLELLVLDDGSRDGSADVAAAWIQEHGGRFARCELRRQENAGICRTLNRLVASSRGTYIVPLASDDQLVPGGIRARVDALEASGWQAAFGNCIIIDEQGRTVAADGLFGHYRLDRPSILDPQARVVELALDWKMPGPVILYRRSLAPAGPYDESLSFEDRDFYLGLLARPDGLQYVDVPVGRYRVHPSNHMARPEKHARMIRDYSRSARRWRRSFPWPLGLAIALDAWELCFAWRDGAWDPRRRRLARPVMALKRRLLRRSRAQARARGAAQG